MEENNPSVQAANQARHHTSGFVRIVHWLWHMLRRKKGETRPDAKGAWLVFFIGIFTIVFSVVLTSMSEKALQTVFPNSLPYHHGIIAVLRDTGIAMMSAGIIALLIEIQSIIDFAKKTLIEALTSNSYLDHLEESGLNKIKKECNERIWEVRGHRKDTDLNQSLMKFESNLSDHLSLPYFDDYTLDVECTEVSLKSEPGFEGLTEDIKMIKKVLKTSFKIINPKREMTEEIIDWPVNIFCPPAIIEPTKLLYVTKFTYAVDDQKPIHITDKLKYFNNVDYAANNLPTYNKQMHLRDSNNKPLIISYNRVLGVQMVEVRYIPLTDSLYSRKLNKAAKNTMIVYTYNVPHVNLKADCFATSFKLTGKDIFIQEKISSVIIMSREWLLPGNGILIVHMPRNPNGTAPGNPTPDLPQTDPIKPVDPTNRTSVSDGQ